MTTNYFVRQKHAMDAGSMYAAEGPLHQRLRAVGLTPADFCQLADIAPSTFTRWAGFPLLKWPLRFLDWVGYARKLEAKLKELGYDTNQFRPNNLPTKFRFEGQYTRTKLSAERRAQLRREAEEWTAWPKPTKMQ